MLEDIDGLLQMIERDRTSASPELDEWINDQLVQVRSDLLKLQRENAYRRFLIRYIKDEHRKLGDEREAPLCECGNDCALIRGELPPQVLAAESLQRGIEEYALKHPGHPQVLYDADDAFRQTKAQVITDLQHIATAAKNGVIPDETVDEIDDAKLTTHV